MKLRAEITGDNPRNQKATIFLEDGQPTFSAPIFLIPKIFIRDVAFRGEPVDVDFVFEDGTTVNYLFQLGANQLSDDHKVVVRTTNGEHRQVFMVRMTSPGMGYCPELDI